jgi:hypothetical protein
MIHSLRTDFAQPRARKRLWCSILCTAALLLLIPTAEAQNTASISGTVRDTADALVPGAKVTLINEASKATRDTTSNGEGFFNFLAVQPATYSIRVQREGFESWKVTGIEVHPGDSLTVPKINLKIGAIVESVTVTAQAAGVTLDSPEHSTLITSADIARLSTTGRDALELVSMLPGFTLNAGTGLSNTGADYNTTSFGAAQVGSYGSNGAAPQQGLVSITSDGAQVIDPGDMGGTTATINMDQVQEVKVQTSNFGADEAKGPIVINAVGKSGGAAYHGGLYMYARDHIFNSNDWLSKDQTPVVTKAPSKYYYPGATIGGPVKIPGTHFNDSKRLTFWAGFEYYDQLTNTNGTYAGPTYAFIPTASMLGGNFSEASLGNAFNVNPSDLAAGCTADYSQSAAYSNIGGDCFSPNNTLDENGKPVNGGIINPLSINAATAAFTKFYPTPNTTPEPSNGYASSGYNWAKNVMAGNNGFQLHGRVDQNFSDSLKLYGTYNWEKINTQQPLNNIYYNPPNTIPYPTPLDTYGKSNYASINLTKILNSTMTNEVVASALYFSQPEQFEDRSSALDTGTPWAAAGYSGGGLKNGTNQLPRIYSYETIGIPNFSMGYVPPGSQYLRKSSWNLTDNFTKIYRTHTIKAGIYAEQTRNNQVTLGSTANGDIQFDRYEGCMPNQTSPSVNPVTNAPITPSPFYLGNTAANFLVGCTGGYLQASFDPSVDMYFNSLEFYATDEWKVNSKLTLTFGIRLSHLPPWTDSHGIGAAVFDPTKYNPVTPGVFDPNMTESASTWPGISWHALDSSIPVAGVGSRPLFYAPRAGLAYDMYGNGKSVFRGGFGVYRSRDSYNVTSAAVATAVNLVNFSSVVNSNNSASANCTFDQLFNAAPFSTPVSSYPMGSSVVPCGYYTGQPAFSSGALPFTTPGAVSNVAANNPHDSQQPVTYNYNFTLDQQLPYSTTLEIAYVGNQSTNLVTLGNLQNQNVIPLGAFFGPDPLTGQSNPTSNIPNSADYRPYPNYGPLDIPNHTAWANYNAMQVSLNKQRGSLVLGINYTWSKAMGVRGNYDTGYIADPVNAHHDYGIVSFDRPQVINFSYSYQEGTKVHVNRELGWFLNNWELSGITTITSGPDLSILNGSTNFGFSAGASYLLAPGSTTSVSIPIGAQEWLGSSDYTLQPTVTCNPRSGLRTKVLSGNQPSRQYANGNCFGLPAQGTQGWWNLPDVHGPAYFKSDLSIYKDIPINDRQNLQLRASGFNFLNHPISSFNNNNLPALALTFEDQACNVSTGAGCYYSQQAAFAGVQLENAGFGYTSGKAGVRIVEFGLKYNF